MKKLLSVLLAAALLAGIFVPLPASAVTGGKLIALTFDDGPGAHTGRLLDGLKARDAKVTFFTVGTSVSRYPELVARAYREGHQIANHSYNHPELTKISDANVRSQLQSTNALLDRACGTGTTYLVRAPYGSADARVRSLVGAPLVFWAVDPLDWKDRNAVTVRNRVVNGASDGAIILLHDIHSTSVDGALAAIDILKGQGYEFVTVNELFRRRGVAMQNGVSYVRGAPNGTDLGPVAAPVLSSRAVNGKLEITMSAQAGAGIYYSLTGPDLNQTSTRYTGPITVTPPCKIWAAAAYNMNGGRSGTVEQTFTKPAAQSPRIEVSANGTMTLSTATPGASLFYVLNSGEVTEQSTPYSTPVTLSPGTVICACAAGTDFLTSRTSWACYSAGGNFFRDVYPGRWYYGAVDQVISAGLMSGQGDGIFAPDQPLTWAQLAALLYRISGEEVTQEEREACPYWSSEAGSYYIDAVCWAYARGLIGGDGFFPNTPPSRQAICGLLVDYLCYRDRELPGSADTALRYRDADQIAPWALYHVEAAATWGLMEGDDTGAFHPQAQVTRAQVAAILLRLRELDREQPEI